jgi:type I restriction enzyme S subunit
LVWEGTKYISFDFFKNKQEYTLKQGDVLFNNTNSKELVGKTCFISENLNCGYSNHMTRIRTKQEILDFKFLSYILNYFWRSGKFEELCNKWIGQAGINNTVLSNLEIPSPSLSEQAEIVAVLEKEREVIAGCKWLIGRYEEKIRQIVAGVFGE